MNLFNQPITPLLLIYTVVSAAVYIVLLKKTAGLLNFERRSTSAILIYFTAVVFVPDLLIAYALNYFSMNPANSLAGFFVIGLFVLRSIYAIVFTKKYLGTNYKLSFLFCVIISVMMAVLSKIGSLFMQVR